MTFKPVHWASGCPKNRNTWHSWMCFAHNNGWKQLAVTCFTCGIKSYMSDRQWQQYDKLRDSPRPWVTPKYQPGGGRGPA